MSLTRGQVLAQGSMFEINFSNFVEGGTTAGSGLVSGSLISPGVYEIFEGSFTVSSGDGLNAGTYTLLPNPNPLGQSTSPSGFFLFDNLLSVNVDPFVNFNGLLFGAGSIEINLFGNPGNGPEYQLYEDTGANVVGDMTITGVPEPATLMFVLPFGVALGFLRPKRAAWSSLKG
jgi:hypothetical protein